MTIDKAIEILKDILRYVKPGDPPDEHDAIKLGIEALKELKESRKTDWRYGGSSLPGETER